MRRDLDVAAGEITEKGTVNQRVVLRHEMALCDELDASEPEALPRMASWRQ